MNHPNPMGLHQLFEAQVERTPHAIALRQHDSQLSYQTVNQRANQWAYQLQALGVGPECLVGLYVERSLETVIALLAILKAGGAYVPLDPTYPAARLAFMVDDAQLNFVVTRAGLVEQLQAMPVHKPPQVICVDQVPAALCHLPTTNPPSVHTLESLAYVIYTSGSTGQPKGVLGLHRGMVNVVAWLTQAYPFAATDVCCQKTALNFVDSIWEIFWPLVSGVPLVIIPDPLVRDLGQLIQTLNHHQITRLVVVPSLLNALLEVTALAKRLPYLNFWVTSGEALSVKLNARFYEQMPQAILLNLYGSSEVSANATWYDTRAFAGQFATIPIGQPLANTTILILDEERKPMPIGEVGELYVGGEGLARGYLNRPALTQKQFMPQPEGVGRFYKTGDQARFVLDHTGEPLIEFMGRVDQQVKVRGIRVELPEIEKTLLQHPDVRECVVTCHDNGAGQQRLTAYVVAHSSADTPTSGPARTSVWRQFLHARLPAYMIPGDFVELEALPLTPNGKVNRLALAALPRPAAQPGMAPRTADEALVRDLWQEVLGVTQIDIHSTFFESGGDSLSLQRLQTKITQTFAVKPSLLDLLRFPTVAMQAAFLTDGTQEALVDLAIIPLQAADLDQTIECISDSFVQGEILAQTMQMTQADFLPFAQKVCSQAVVDGLSLIAKDQRTGAVIGFSICEDFMTPADEAFDDFAKNQKPILAFLAEMDAHYKEKQPQLKAGHLLHILLGGSNAHYRGVGSLLQKATLTLAQAQGYQGVISNDTGPLAQALSAADGFVEVFAMHYRSFVYAQSRPFHHLPDDLYCKLMLKTFDC